MTREDDVIWTKGIVYKEIMMLPQSENGKKTFWYNMSEPESNYHCKKITKWMYFFTDY